LRATLGRTAARIARAADRLPRSAEILSELSWISALIADAVIETPPPPSPIPRRRLAVSGATERIDAQVVAFDI